MNYYWISTIAIIYLVFLTIRKPQKEKKEISTATIAISNCLFSPTSENPSLSLPFLKNVAFWGWYSALACL